MNVSKSKPSILTPESGCWIPDSSNGNWDSPKFEVGLRKTWHSLLQTFLSIFFCTFVVQEQGGLEVVCWLGRILSSIRVMDHLSRRTPDPPHTSPSCSTDLSQWCHDWWLQTIHCKPTWFGIQCFVPINSHLPSKLISHRRQNSLVNTEAQISQKHIYVTLLQSHRKRIYQ